MDIIFSKGSSIMSRSVSLGLCSLVILGIIAPILWAQDVQVDRDELASIGDRSIQFINYIGPYEFVNTLDQIRDIGRALGAQIDPSRSGEASVGGKYRVLHIVNPEIPEGLDADIFILEETAAVDHIANLRTILAGYLETAYGFSGRNAYLLAEFVTYYNAVYRKDSAMVGERYKNPVSRSLTPTKIGLDTHYSNWPGQTEMLIPLRAGTEGPKIDTAAISDDAVVDEMRQEEQMGLDSRRDMVELREEELEKEQVELDSRRDELERREDEVTEELEELEELKQREESGTITPAEQERIEDFQAERDAVEEEKAVIAQEQREIEERTEDLMRMRDQIAGDENTMMERRQIGEETFSSAEPVTPVWFLTVDDEGGGIPFGRVVKYNMDNGERLAVSDITAVRGRTLVLLPDALLVIAGKDDGNSKVRPMLLDLSTLETQREGTHDVFPGSLMTVRGSDIYLVTAENGQWRLGQFNGNLERTAVSEVEIEPWTSVSFDGASLFVQALGGEILKLSTSDLREEARLE